LRHADCVTGIGRIEQWRGLAAMRERRKSRENYR
jgi:hypothetical protein